VVLRSDGEGEFGEGGREPMLWVLIHAELVVATSEVLDEGVSGVDHPGGAKLFEAAHRPQPSLESPTICFDEVIGVLLGDVTGGRHQFVEHTGIGGALSVVTSFGWVP
jgi:hypothetical protein